MTDSVSFSPIVCFHSIMLFCFCFKFFRVTFFSSLLRLCKALLSFKHHFLVEVTMKCMCCKFQVNALKSCMHHKLAHETIFRTFHPFDWFTTLQNNVHFDLSAGSIWVNSIILFSVFSREIITLVFQEK